MTKHLSRYGCPQRVFLPGAGAGRVAGVLAGRVGSGLVIMLAIAALSAPPALAVNKDMVQLQTQVQELQDAVARLQQSNDERMGVLKDLVQQSADTVN